MRSIAHDDIQMTYKVGESLATWAWEGNRDEGLRSA